MGAPPDDVGAAAEQMEAARVAIGRLVEQGRLDANAATRQLLALDLEARRTRPPGVHVEATNTRRVSEGA